MSELESGHEPARPPAARRSLFPRSLSVRMSLLGPALVAITAATTGLLGYRGYAALIDNEHESALTNRTASDAEQLRLALVEVQNDVRMLARLPLVRELGDRRAGPDDGDRHRWRERANELLGPILESKPFYDQIRVIAADAEGYELARVDRSGDGWTAAREHELQAKGHRDYVHGALHARPGTLYVSEVTLNREHGEIEVPHRPTLRVARRIDHEGGDPVAIVVVNLAFDRLVARSLTAAPDSSSFVVDQHGNFLAHPDPALCFGTDLGHGARLASEFPQVAAVLEDAEQVWAPDFAESEEGAAHDARFVRIRPFPDEPDRFLVYGVAGSNADVARASSAIAWQVLFGALVLQVLSCGVAFVIGRRMTAPLERLTRTADRLAEGEDITFDLEEREDEVGRLSQSLRRMHTSLEEREDRLEEANVDLEYFARIASHDLREPARRVSMLSELMFVGEDRVDPSMAADVRGESLRMVEKLTDLRAFARLGSSGSARTEIDLDALVGTVLAMFATAIEERGVQVERSPLPRQSGYPTLVEVLYQNLVRNALEHSEGEGIRIGFGSEETDEGTVLEVWNTGSGCAEAAECAFVPCSSSEECGPRLGVSICRRIAERHAGRIWVERDADRIRIRFIIEGASGRVEANRH